MKKLFILSFALIASLLFVQCKKSEILTEEVISTEKSLTPDVLNGTSWNVLAIDSDPNSVDINWISRQPKFTFNNGIIEMTLGLDFCSKQYLTIIDKVIVTTISTCSITNPNHVQLYNLFDGAFIFRSSVDNPEILYLKSIDGTILTLRKINNLSTTDPTYGFIVE